MWQIFYFLQFQGYNVKCSFFFFLLRGCNFIIDLHYFKQLAVVANEISCSGYVYFGEHLKFVSGNLDS